VVPPRAAPGTSMRWARLARSVMRRPVTYLVAVTAVLVALALPFLRIQLGGFDERVLPEGTESRVVSERMVNEFEGGGDYPISVLVGGPLGDLPQRIEALEYATAAQVAAQRGDTTLIRVTYAGEPTSADARDLVRAIRALDHSGTMLVGGRPAADVDQLSSFQERLPWMLSLIAMSTFLLLFLAFGSLVLPLKAIVMNIISIGASFGVVVWVFQDGHLADLLGVTVTGFLEPSNLVLMLAVLFGLATDYEVFLLSRVREEWDRCHENTRAVALGLQRTGGIITAAALLLIIVVAGFATGGTATIKMLGIGTVVAIAVDAALVRTLLVPATMRLLGRWNWWAPGPLSRLYSRYGIRES
jgi:trehalose monomycolate/heme transporter